MRCGQVGGAGRSGGVGRGPRWPGWDRFLEERPFPGAHNPSSPPNTCVPLDLPRGPPTGSQGEGCNCPGPRSHQCPPGAARGRPAPQPRSLAGAPPWTPMPCLCFPETRWWPRRRARGHHPPPRAPFTRGTVPVCPRRAGASLSWQKAWTSPGPCWLVPARVPPRVWRRCKISVITVP